MRKSIGNFFADLKALICDSDRNDDFFHGLKFVERNHATPVFFWQWLRFVGLTSNSPTNRSWKSSEAFPPIMSGRFSPGIGIQAYCRSGSAQNLHYAFGETRPLVDLWFSPVPQTSLYLKTILLNFPDWSEVSPCIIWPWPKLTSRNGWMVSAKTDPTLVKILKNIWTGVIKSCKPLLAKTSFS